MRLLLYTLLLSQYGVTYIDFIKDLDGDITIYGVNKATGQYSFWKIGTLNSIRLKEVCDSRNKALFSYRILAKGV